MNRLLIVYLALADLISDLLLIHHCRYKKATRDHDFLPLVQLLPDTLSSVTHSRVRSSNLKLRVDANYLSVKGGRVKTSRIVYPQPYYFFTKRSVNSDTGSLDKA